MNKRIEELALKAGLLNYVDLEAPRRYFVDGYADIEEVEKFAEMIVQECIRKIDDMVDDGWYADTDKLKQHFGVEE